MLTRLFGFNKMLVGGFGISVGILVVMFALNKDRQIQKLNSQYRWLLPSLGVVKLAVFYLAFRPILFFSLSILIPSAISIVHASIRSRGLKNKISNKMEQIGAPVYINTPMGFLLSSLGLETKDFED